MVESMNKSGVRATAGSWVWAPAGPDGQKCPDYFLKMSLEECLELTESNIKAFHGAAGGRINAFFGIVVNIDVYVAGCHQTGTGSKNHRHQRQHNGSEHDDTENNLNTHDSTLPLQLHAGK